MDNLFLEEFVEKVDPKTIKEIQIHNKSNIFQSDNDVLESIDDYDINTNTIIHKQNNISDDTNEPKIYDISKLYTKEITKERILISYEDMNACLSYATFNGSYECEFKLNKTYKNVIGIRLDNSIYENNERSGSLTENASHNSHIYLDVIINNIPREACINNLKGYNIIKRLPYEYIIYLGPQGFSRSIDYDSAFSKPNYFYPRNLDKLSLSLKYDHRFEGSDLIDLIDVNKWNFDTKEDLPGYMERKNELRFSFEFELTILNRNM